MLAPYVSCQHYRKWVFFVEENLQWKDKQEIIEFNQQLEKTISDYLGFGVEFPLDFSSNSSEVDFGMKVNSAGHISGVSDQVISTLVLEITSFLEHHVNKTGMMDADTIHVIPYFISMSLTFPGFYEFDNHDKYKIMNFMRDLTELGSLTYELEPVDIGVVLLQEKKLKKTIENLDVDYIPISGETDFKRFILNEKPLLRLIDNKSLTVIINEHFEIKGMLRKRPGSLALNTLLTSVFDNHSMNHLFKQIKATAIQAQSKIKSIESVSKEAFDTISNYLIDNLKNVSLPEDITQPDFLYLFTDDQQLNIYCPNDFVIANKNGTWKLKHYDLLFAHIMGFIFWKQYPYLTLLDHKEERLRSFIIGMYKLSSFIKDLSSHKVSSIITIVENDDYNLALSSEEANKLLMEANFKHNNLDKSFIKVVQNNNIHLNLLDMDPSVMTSIASVDGTVVMDSNFNILSFAETISVPQETNYEDTYGTGTIASRVASKYGVSLKVSEDGDIKLFTSEKLIITV